MGDIGRIQGAFCFILTIFEDWINIYLSLTLKFYHNLLLHEGVFFLFSSKDCYAFLGSHLNDLDCIFVMVGYDLAPEGKYI